MRQLITTSWDVVSSDDAATAVEYALLVAFIALAIIGGATLLGINVTAIFQNVNLHNALS